MKYLWGSRGRREDFKDISEYGGGRVRTGAVGYTLDQEV